MTTAAPAAGTFRSGQFAGSDQRLALGGGVSVTGPVLPVGSAWVSSEQAAADASDSATRSVPA